MGAHQLTANQFSTLSSSPAPPATILIVDDDPELNEVLSLKLETSGYRVLSAATAQEAQSLLTKHAECSLILLDQRLNPSNAQDESGIDLLEWIREEHAQVPVILITAHGDVRSAVRAISAGAKGYVQKPFAQGELSAKIHQVLEQSEIERASARPASSIESGTVRQYIRSIEPTMNSVLERIALASRVDSSVLITGESGTGKELAARALHATSRRASGPFIAINCGAIPENLLEAELFGYQKGAFTGAFENKKGLISLANRGTLFLDEIGDAPLAIQVKLLRVLQDREIRAIGSAQAQSVDIRVVAATHRDLEKEVMLGKFRQDLFYRIHVLRIQLPPLRDRPKDILLLANCFSRELSEKMGVPNPPLTAGALRALQKHSWPGNVRELQNRIEQALALSAGSPITARALFHEQAGSEDFDTAVGGSSGHDGLSDSESLEGVEVMEGDAVQSFHEAKQSFEKNYWSRMLSVTAGNIARAARLARKSRTEVYGLLRKHRLDPKVYKP